MIDDIPAQHRTPALCRIAVEQFGCALEYVPIHARTYDLCLTAIQQNGWALLFVPQQFRTIEFCRAAIQNAYGTGADLDELLDAIPAEIRSQVVG